MEAPSLPIGPRGTNAPVPLEALASLVEYSNARAGRGWHFASDAGYSSLAP